MAAACENCKFRQKWIRKPGSFLGRLWKFHTRFCPGWKKYFNSLSPEEQAKALKPEGQK